MKDVIEQYLKIIKELECRNRELEDEKESNLYYKYLYHELLKENKQLIENYQWVDQQLNSQK